MAPRSQNNNLSIQTLDELEACHLQAQKGDARAQFMLGECYAAGNFVEKDESRAAKLYAEAASQGYRQAIANLSSCYFTGAGVCRDDEEGLRLLRRLNSTPPQDFHHKRQSAPTIFDTGGNVAPRKSPSSRTRSLPTIVHSSSNRSIFQSSNAFYGNKNSSPSSPRSPASSASWSMIAETRCASLLITPRRR